MDRPILSLVHAPKVHDLKCWSEYFRAVKSGAKPYEIRVNDRGYAVGDTLRLHEWNHERAFFTGDVVERLVTYMTSGGEWGLPPNLCVLGIPSPSPKPGGTEP